MGGAAPRSSLSGTNRISVHVDSPPVEQTWIEELREFIAIPSVSADPAHADDVRRAGEWVRDFVKRIGGEAELVPYGERDLVIGEIPANADGDQAGAPTVMIYGH